MSTTTPWEADHWMRVAAGALAEVIDELGADAPARRPAPLRVVKEAQQLERRRRDGFVDDVARTELVRQAAWRQLARIADPELRAAEDELLTELVAGVDDRMTSAERARIRRYGRQRIRSIDADGGDLRSVRAELVPMIRTMRFRLGVEREVARRLASGSVDSTTADLVRRWSTTPRFDHAPWEPSDFVDHALAVERERLEAPPIGDGDVRLRRADLRVAWVEIEAELLALACGSEQEQATVGVAWAKARSRLEWDDRLGLPPPERPLPWLRRILERAQDEIVPGWSPSVADGPEPVRSDSRIRLDLEDVVPVVEGELVPLLEVDLDEAGITFARIIERHDPRPFKRNAFERVISVSEELVDHLGDEVGAGVPPPEGAPGPVVLVLGLTADDVAGSGLRARVFHARTRLDPTYAAAHPDGPPRSANDDGSQPGAYQDLRRLTIGSPSRNVVVRGGVRWVVSEVLARALDRCRTIVDAARAGGRAGR